MCPTGSACGLDGLCRRGTGTFVLGSVETNFSYGSRLGDFDGSGTDDVLTAGLSRIDISYLDGAGAVASRQAFGRSGFFLLPEVGHLDGPSADGIDRADAVFTTDGDVVVALGTENGLVPSSYAGVRLGIEPPVQFFAVPGAAEPGVDVAAAMAVVGDGPVAIVELDGQSIRAVREDWPVDAQPYHVLAANFDHASETCHELVFSYGLLFLQWRVCGAGDARVAAEPTVLTLGDPDDGVLRAHVPPTVAPPAAVDLDADGALDLVVEVNECAEAEPEACDGLLATDETRDCCVLYVGWGQVGVTGRPNGRFASSRDEDARPDALGPWRPVAVGQGADAVFLHPLAWGDFDADPWPDVVTSLGVVRGGPPDVGPIALLAQNPGLPWSSAAVADVDRDGLDDVVAAPDASPSLDYLRGDPSGTMARAGIQTERPSSQVLLGDFDGDGRSDIVSRTFSSDLAAEELAVLFFDDGTFSPPQSIGRFPIRQNDPSTTEDDESPILQIAAAPLITNRDPLHDLAAITTYVEDGVEKVAIALYEGRSNRQLVAPIVIAQGGEVRDVSVVTFGHFDDGGPTIVADRFAVRLDPTSLDLAGGATEIEPLGPGLAAAFGDLTPRPDLMVVTTGNLDGDDHDELVAAVPGCAPETPCAEASRVCCQDGTETTRLFLLERVGEGFAPIAAAPSPVTIPAAVSRAFLEEDVARVGRLDVVDLNGDGVGEILAIGGARVDRRLETRGSIVALVDGAFRAMPLPTEVVLDGATVPVNVHGFAAFLGPSGAPMLMIGTSAGLFRSSVDRRTLALGPPELVLDGNGLPLALGEVSNVETGDVTGDGLADLVLTRPFATEVFVGLESLAAPGESP